MKQIPMRMFKSILFSSGYNGSPCWVWTGFINPKGYGQVSFGGKSQRIHRVLRKQDRRKMKAGGGT